MDFSPSPFLVAWKNAMIIAGIVLAAAALLVYVLHMLRVASIRDPHKKYEFITHNEIRSLKLCFYLLGGATACAANLYGTFTNVGVAFYVRTGMSIAVGTLVGYVAYLILEYYYPTKVDKKLKKWRYMPRTNPKNGHKMRLLSEEEEDVHMDEGMKAEEDIFSIDYDVWIDESTGDVKIEKYPGHLQALQCNNCGFYTMKIVKEEISREPTNTDPGELIKHYQCSYCKSVRNTSFHISRKEAEDYKSQKPIFRKNKDVEMVKVEVQSTLKGRKHYEFESIDQARQFLEEFDLDNS